MLLLLILLNSIFYKDEVLSFDQVIVFSIFSFLNFLNFILLNRDKVIKFNAELLGLKVHRKQFFEFKELFPVDMDLFSNTLRKKADANGTILISMVDESFIEMAINLFETSIKKHNITNYIFLSVNTKATQILLPKSIDAITVWNNNQGEIPSLYGSVSFSKKNLYKTAAATIGLKMGYKIVVMDTDIILFKNLYPYLVCNHCDLIFSTEGYTDILNAGFYVAFPTRNSILTHEYVLEMVTESNFVKNEQDVFNRLIKRALHVKIKKLNPMLFQNGRTW